VCVCDDRFINLSYLFLFVELDKLSKQIERSKAVISKFGAPLFVARILLQVDAACKKLESSKDGRKKLNKVHAKALNIVKQKIVKFLATYSTEVALVQEVRCHWSKALIGCIDALY
jgi:hypothetical protein